MPSQTPSSLVAAPTSKDILINGSGALVRTLIDDHLLDELRLLVHPTVVGSGIRLFPDSSNPMDLDLVDSHSFANGVIALTYRPAKGASHIRSSAARAP